MHKNDPMTSTPNNVDTVPLISEWNVKGAQRNVEIVSKMEKLILPKKTEFWIKPKKTSKFYL